jgi:hypothetical protein
MSRIDIDLSKLPEPLRAKLQERLDRMPVELRARLAENLARLPAPVLEKLLEHGSPMLDRLLDRVEQSPPIADEPPGVSPLRAKPNSFIASNLPAGHYNKTVQRGDSLSLRTLVVTLIAIGVLFLLYNSGLLGS